MPVTLVPIVWTTKITYLRNRTAALLWHFFVIFTSLFVFRAAFAAECESPEFTEDQIFAAQSSERHKLFYPLRGRNIRSIKVIVNDIFDETNPSENNFLYRGLNRVQFNTRENTIRKQLLFEEGDNVNSRKIAETVRNLDRRNYLLEVMIYPQNICADSVDIVVSARDAWVIEPVVEYGRDGGEDSSGFGLKDGNFLGSGDELSVVYSQTPERSSLAYEYRTHSLFGQRLDSEFVHADSSDGERYKVSLVRPFFSLRTRWSAGVSAEKDRQVETIRFQDEEINEYSRESTRDEIFVGRSLKATDDYISRALFGFTREEDGFEETDDTVMGIPDTRQVEYVWVGWEYLEDRFTSYRNLEQLQRVEHIPLGLEVGLRLGYGAADFRGQDRVWRSEGDLRKVLWVNEANLLRWALDMDMWFYPEESSTQASVLETEFNYHYMLGSRQRWFVRLRGAVGDQLQQFEQLTVGGTQDLRGYPLEYQRGNRRVTLNLEHRYFSGVHLLNLMRFGGLVFIDAGRAWGGEPEEVERQPWLADVGIGLRASPSKLGSPLVLHLDFARPLVAADDLETWLYSVSVEAYF